MKFLTLILGLVLSANAWSAQVGMRAFMLNGAAVDRSAPLLMEAGDKALIEIFVDDVAGVPGNPKSGLAAFAFTVFFDSALVSIANPNTDRFTRNRPFRPLHPHEFAVLEGQIKPIDDVADLSLRQDLREDFDFGIEDCVGARGGRSGDSCHDSTEFLTSTGRTIFELGVDPFPADGQLRLELATADLTPGKVLPTPTGGGVLAVFELAFLDAFTATALAGGGSPTALTVGDIKLGQDDGSPITAQGSSFAVNAVPLPGSGLALLGALGVLGYRARSRAAARK